VYARTLSHYRRPSPNQQQRMVSSRMSGQVLIFVRGRQQDVWAAYSRGWSQMRVARCRGAAGSRMTLRRPAPTQTKPVRRPGRNREGSRVWSRDRHLCLNCSRAKCDKRIEKSKLWRHQPPLPSAWHRGLTTCDDREGYQQADNQMRRVRMSGSPLNGRSRQGPGE
jgi:hypothetical protein